MVYVGPLNKVAPFVLAIARLKSTQQSPCASFRSAFQEDVLTVEEARASPVSAITKVRKSSSSADLLSCYAITVAVGTTITDRPPHRSVRARLRIRLLRRMSGVEACIGIGVQNAGWRNPPVQDWGQTFPTHLCALTAADQNTLP